jgi:hypothetical protein
MGIGFGSLAIVSIEEDPSGEGRQFRGLMEFEEI